METKEKFKSKTTLLTEIEHLKNLIAKREDWLNRKENKMRKTFEVVLKDTKELKLKLKELEKQINNCKI